MSRGIKVILIGIVAVLLIATWWAYRDRDTFADRLESAEAGTGVLADQYDEIRTQLEVVCGTGESELTDTPVCETPPPAEDIVENVPGPGLAVALPGPQGERGPQGPQGVQGPQGQPGRNGEDGVPGLMGEPGVAGEPGTSGEPGVSGPAGPEGPAGPTGPAGPAGPAGVGIATLEVREDCHLWVTLTDGTVIDAGEVCKMAPPVDPGTG